jgi:exodeoxyribonuclease-5
VELSPEQGRAAQAVSRWLGDPSRQVFYLAGGAGTGKTSIARHLANGIEGEVYFAAFTGKATYVLQTKGCRNAQTIHKLIYIPKSRSAAKLIEMEERLEKMAPDDPERPKLQKAVDEEHKNVSRPAFSLNLDSPLKGAKLLVVDEVSMVDEGMGRDLESFGCKILVLGDKNQLPPVYGAGYFTEREPDFTLREIHRQAKDSPIIRLAHEISQGSMPRVGMHGSSRVVESMNAEMALGADQMLVGKNESRAAFNRRVRALRQFEGDLPLAGDKLVCLKNSRDYPLLNGSLWNVEGVTAEADQNTLLLSVRDPEGTRVDCLAHKAHFIGERLPWWAKNDAEEFDYGYALTVHKAQGSQWDDVLVYDEGRVFRNDRWRWLYTAVTRAAERVTIVRT